MHASTERGAVPLASSSSARPSRAWVYHQCGAAVSPAVRLCPRPGATSWGDALGDVLWRRPRVVPMSPPSTSTSPDGGPWQSRPPGTASPPAGSVGSERRPAARSWPASTPRRNRDRGRARGQRHRTRRCGGPANIEMEVLPAALRSWRHPLVTAAPRHARRRSATGARAMSPRAVGTPPSRSTRIVPSLSATRPCATNLARSRLTLRSPGY